MILLRNSIFIVLTVLLFSQCDKLTNKGNLKHDISFNEAAGKRVQITGTIHHREIYLNTEDVSISIPYVSWNGATRRITVPISDKGTFHFDFELTQPQDIHMKPYLDFLYVNPGDSLHIELDFKDLANVKLSGKPTITINHQLYKYFDNTFYRKSDYGIEIDSSSLEETIGKLNKKRQNNHAKRNLFLRQNKVREEVKTLTESMIELDYYVALVSVMQTHDHLNKNSIDPELLMEELNEQVTKYFRSGLYFDSHFDFIVSAYLPILQRNNNFEAGESTIDWIKRTIPNDTIKNFAFATIASSALTRKELDFFMELSAQINQEYLSERLMQEYLPVWYSMNNPGWMSAIILEKNIDSPVSSFFEGNTNPLAKLTKKNSGRVQVIDIWTTWCGPCISSLDEYKKLMTQYEDKEVDFIFICTDSSPENYDKIIQSKNMNKKHFYLCSQKESRFLTKTIKSLSFPFGVIVNKEGVVVDYGLHVRPELGLAAKIDHLLKYDKLLKPEQLETVIVVK